MESTATITIPTKNRNSLITGIECDDKDLLINIKEASDYKAFTVLFNKYYLCLCEQSFAIIRCEQKAEEIISDLFYKLWRNRENLTVASNVKYYLYTSARNRTIDHLRKYRREKNFSDVEVPEYVSAYVKPDDYTVGEDCRGRIVAAIDKLPPKAKKVFLMSREQGLKYKEIAEKLDLSIKTVETHIRRSLIFLRSEYYGR